jgi:very-short-patch-repair endonuclease
VTDARKTPFPLEGGRAGDGGGVVAERTPHGPVAGGVGRARHLRREMTVAERMLWKDLRRLEMNFRRQAPIGRYIVDFVHHAGRLVIEVDGPRHDDIEVASRDADRTAWLNSAGYRVVRFSEKDVRERLSDIVERIVAEATPPPSPTLPPSRGKGDVRWMVR